MMDGHGFKRATNIAMIEYFLKKIQEKYGDARLSQALKSVSGFIDYYESTYGQYLPGLRQICQAFSRKYKMAMKFIK